MPQPGCPSAADPFGALAAFAGADGATDLAQALAAALALLESPGQVGGGQSAPFAATEASPALEPWHPRPASPRAADRESCEHCGGQMRRDPSDLNHVCGDCGLVVFDDTAATEDDGPHEAPNAARLRLVGPNSNQLQPDLYRSSAGTTAAAQKKQIFEEYCAHRQLYIEASGRAFPLNACQRAADHYNAVQQNCVKRSQNKKAIMAACLHRGCLEIGFSPTKAEIAEFMQLPHRGIARGENFVRALVADGRMDVDLNADPCRPEVETLFAHLGLDEARHAPLRDAVFDVVQTAVRNNIGTSSTLRSKVAGATFVVLRRCRDRGLVPRPLSLQDVCQNRMRKHTLERFSRQLDNYHSFFEGCFARAGLDTAPPRP